MSKPIRPSDLVTVRGEGAEVFRVASVTTAGVARLHDLDGNKYGLYSVDSLTRVRDHPPAAGVDWLVRA